MNLDELVRSFDDCTLPAREWTHHAHLSVGTWYVRHYGSERALQRLRAGIRRLNDAHGTKNSANSGYHETITRAYVLLIEQSIAAAPTSASDAVLAESIVRGPLGDSRLLLEFYSLDVLRSVRARAEWVEPDRAILAPGRPESA
jgi:hypothetical protein